MKKMIIVIVSSILVVILVSYLFDRCSHAIVEDLYDDEVQSETTYEETTKPMRKSFPIEENTDGYPQPDKYPDDAKFINYVEKHGYSLYEKYKYDPKPVIYEMCKKNVDWSIYPISDDVYSKFNEKDGLLGNIEFDSIELVNWRPINEYPNSYYTEKALDPAEVIITQGKKKTKYYIKFNAFGRLIKEIEVYTYYDSFITDENGNELELGGPVTDLDVLKLLVDKYDTKVGLSPKFKAEHPNFNGLVDIKKESNWDGNIEDIGYMIYVVDRKSSFNNGIAVFEIDSTHHEYQVDFKLDERGFLDEAEVTRLD